LWLERRLLLFANRLLHLGHEIRRHLADPVLLRMLHGILQYLGFVLSTDDVRASGRRIDLRAFDDLAHEILLTVAGIGRRTDIWSYPHREAVLSRAYYGWPPGGRRPDGPTPEWSNRCIARGCRSAPAWVKNSATESADSGRPARDPRRPWPRRGTRRTASSGSPARRDCGPSGHGRCGDHGDRRPHDRRDLRTDRDRMVRNRDGL